MLWALAQPAAMLGLVAGFVLGNGLRALAQWGVSRALRLPPPALGVDPLGVIAAVLSGTGWGRPAVGNRILPVLAGPAAVLVASQLVLGVLYSTFDEGLIFALNRPSDVLRGAFSPSPTAQLLLSTGVGLLCFGLVALLPLPTLDGYRVVTALGIGPPPGPVAEQVGPVAVLLLLVIRVDGAPPLVTLLDAVAGPVMRLWAGG